MIEFEKHISATIKVTIEAAEFYLNNPMVPEHIHHYISGQLRTLEHLTSISHELHDEHERLKTFMKHWKQLEYA